MSIRHHPTDETLAAHAAGALDPGRRIVLGSHLERCDACRRFLLACEEVGGAMLDDLPMAEMAPDALTHMLARLDTASAGAMPSTVPRDVEPGLPRALAGYRLGPWRWIGPGVEMRPILLPEPRPVSVFLLKGRAGTRLPKHTHRGTEFTSILAGAFAHDGGRFGAGDFEEADEAVEHRPVVTPEGECICLVALEGKLKLSGILGALLGPFIRL
jgi:putative transcriptional regulator